MWVAGTRESHWCCSDSFVDLYGRLCWVIETTNGVYDQRVNDRDGLSITAFVLAGGKSSRMGSDKAFLRLGDETLLSRALKVARTVASDVWIVGDAKKFAALGQVVEDVYRDRGPLGGIHGALSGSVTELNLVLAVDLPFVGPEFLEYVVAQARGSDAMVTVPRAGAKLQPLCAVYRRGFAQVAEESLREGRNKIDALFAKVATRVIEEDELLRAGFSADRFRNLNTPDDWERAKNLHSGPLSPISYHRKARPED
jgi:molybdopterin-guanine dinucleotide biosynthesis protein A